MCSTPRELLSVTRPPSPRVAQECRGLDASQTILSTHHFAGQPITMFLNVTHHEVLDCIAAAVQKLHLGAACGTDCGAAASFKIFISLFTFVFF